MALNPRKKPGASSADIEKLADKLADKPYGGGKPAAEEKAEKPVFRSFTMPRDLDAKLVMRAAQNRIDGSGPTNLSALLRHIVAEYIKANPVEKK